MGGLSSLQAPHTPAQGQASEAVTQQETRTEHPWVAEEDKSGKKGKQED